MEKNKVTRFEEAASERRQNNILSELWHFVRSNKKWWMLPLIAALLMLGFLLLLSSSAVAPFIYTLF
jgi:hypothetical protein